jgi:hypothetical protein
MCDEPDNAADEPPLDADEVARALRQQIDAVKAQMAAHREVMVATGLAQPQPPEDEAEGAPQS